MAGKLLAAEPPDITEEGFGFRIYLYVSSPELCIRWVIGHLHHLDAPASPPQSHSTLCFFQECDQEDSLATDDFLVDYFNEFLSLPTFSEAVRFNVDYGVFEIVNNAPQLLEKQLKKILRNQQPRNPIYDVVRKGKNDIKPVQMNAPYEDEAINVNYNIMCLSREEGIEWIKKERLPAFLESDCYFEYRLAKLVSQVRWSGSGMNITVNTEFSPWVLRKPPSPPPPVVEEDNVIIMKKFYISLGEGSYTQTKDWFALAKQSLQTVPTFSLPSCVLHSKPEPPVVSSISESFIFDDRIHPRTKRDSSETIRLTSHFEEEEDGSVSVQDTPSQALLRIYLERQQDADESLPLHFTTCEEFLRSYIDFILRVAIHQIFEEPLTESPDYINFNKVAEVVLEEGFEPLHGRNVLSETFQTTNEKSKEMLERANSKSESIGPESRAYWCMSHKAYDIGNRKEFERFKKFIKGTLGERYWSLWMDIERLKVLKDRGRHQRHLEKMKKFYLVSNGDCYLSTEILSKFKLLDASQWNEEHLRNIQTEVVKPLLLYWAPRFCVTHSSSAKHASAELKFWHLRQEKPRKDVDPFPQMATLLPLRPKSCIPQISDMQKEESNLLQCPKSPKKPPRVKTAGQKPWKSKSLYLISSKDDAIEKGLRHRSESNKVIRLTSFTDISECLKPQLDRRYTYTEEPSVKTMTDGALGGFDMENLLQSLYVENRAGFFFTKFCEHSGNKLWKNSVYFWFDLQAYHQLFYQETLHPFKVCKQAQYLFATYIAPSATLDIGLQQEKKKEIYMKIQPPFEDLFDTAEEYILLLLLEPWTKMVKLDQVAFGKVELVEDTRQLDSTYFRKLQALHKETFSKKAEIQMRDIAEELLLQKHERKIGVWKPVESKWISSSCEIIAFRKALLNPVTVRQFQRFVALKGDLLENDVLFWQEVQKYKDLCHSHCEESIIHKKIMTIINCFINSSIPPALQIDIPVEQAQKIIEHRKELGPYVFREAQMTIFGVLFKFWPQFCEFRKNLTDEKIMSVLERRQEYNKQKKKLAVIEDENFAKDGIKQYPSSSGSAIKTAALATDPVLGLQAYGRQPTWCYSKYIEALEQERILLKIQEELEKKLFTATPSFTNFKSTASTMSLKKTVSSHNIQSWITVVVLADNIPPQRWDTS
ncbi:regulator of G-protein signaling 22 isoform X13 [Canis lupus dingo]|uniref:regulator of G-protein signaling 22 isoform X13 n=1 Tax=Canis lupus familiaris TaxID=9615 RepID=UPI000BAA35AD|nr:regulator of G-protein signaling 22 isoform X13 [Canis lupus familiaris]XP_048949065.1 regulator of G-protein signaling 22 isoform X13 [Canis lupus dingo]|eukprot:XP_022282284.1 regulator of G-protein signaling 22 isoform X14 [Canis lupus familiaris]